MATSRDSKAIESVHNDPNFAVICSFISRYGSLIGLPDISFEALEKWIDDQRYMNDSVKDLLLKLMKRWKSSVNEDRLSQYLIKFCHTYSEVDAFELQSCGFERCRTATKLRIVKALLEQQFDTNTKFKEKVNEISASELRSLPIGRDMNGKAYWFLSDKDMNIRIYCEEQDDVQNETWQIVVSDRTQLENLISKLEEIRTKTEEKIRSASPSTVISESAKSEADCGQLFDVQERLDVTQDEAKDVIKKEPDTIKTEPGDEPTLAEVKEEPLETAKAQIFSGKLENLETQNEKSEAKEDNLPPEDGNVSEKRQSTDVIENADKVETKIESRLISCVSEETAAAAEVIENKVKLEDAGEQLPNSDVKSETSCELLPAMPSTSEELEQKSVKEEDKRVLGTDVLPNDAGQQTSSISELSEEGVTSFGRSPAESHADVVTVPVTATDLEKPPDKELSSAAVETLDSAQENEKPTNKEDSKNRVSVKRKRGALIDRQPSTDRNSSRSESDISETASDTKSQSTAEEPPTKRKREKTLKTAAERDRRLWRVKGEKGLLDLRLKPSNDEDTVVPEVFEKSTVEDVQVQPTTQPTDSSKGGSDNPKVGDSENPKVGDSENPKVGDSENPKISDSENPEVCESDNPKVGDLIKGIKEQEHGATDEKEDAPGVETSDKDTKVLPFTGEESTLSNEAVAVVEGEVISTTVEETDNHSRGARRKTTKQGKWGKRKGRQEEKENAAEKKVESKPGAGEKRRKKRGLKPSACQEGGGDYEPNSKLVCPESNGGDKAESKASGQDSACVSEDDIPLIELRRSTRCNKGQRKFEPLIVHEPKKRKKKVELEETTSRNKFEVDEKRLKKEAELAAKNKKKRRGKNESDDDFVPGKLGARKSKGRTRGKKQDDGGSEEESEELEEELFEPETEDESLHFSPSSSDEELESDGSLYEPKGRNAKRAAALKENSKSEAVVPDLPCSRCGQCDQPEWLLLCDHCEAGYHTACLRPPLLAIPEGDWLCPPCEHANLIKNLQEQLLEYDKKAKQNVRLIQRKERLAFVGISLSNILPSQERRPLPKYPDLFDDEQGDEETECEDEGEDTEAEDKSAAASEHETVPEDSEYEDEPPRKSHHKKQGARRPSRDYREARRRRSPSEGSFSEESEEDDWAVGRRSRRQRKEISYKFEEFDELINEAIEDDVKDAKGAGNFGRGKDMSNITGIPPSDDESHNHGGKRKKRRRLTKLDSNDEDDDDDDDESEEYQVSEDESSASAEEEEDTIDADEESDVWQTRRSASRSKKGSRRSNRSHKRSSLYDDDFVIDDYDSADDRPFHRARRAAAQRRINYQEDSDETDTSQTQKRQSKKKTSQRFGTSSSGTDEASDDTGSRRRKKASKKTKDDSDYMPSADEDLKVSNRVSTKKSLSHKRIGSDSDDSGGKEVVSKKKGRMNNRVIESSDEDDDDNDEAEDSAQVASDPKDSALVDAPIPSPPSSLPRISGEDDPRIRKVPDVETDGALNCVALKPDTAKVFNGHCSAAALNGNSESHNNHNFSIASLLKTTPVKQPTHEYETSDLLQSVRDEDSLVDTFDLVDYVTRIDPS